jgi:hypothetical protein
MPGETFSDNCRLFRKLSWRDFSQAAMIRALGGNVGQSKHSQVQAQTATAILSGKRFITDVQLEEAYGVPVKTLRNWRVLGRGPFYRKFGKGVRYDVNLLEDWIKSLPAGGEGIPSSSQGRSQASQETNP